ncbi:MAG: hypothetical protein H0V82_13215 [Candidatus Protochlamydia sp.]|nr:hypothetical protein [Candidatus Protochlamydia sp.]
MNLQPITQIQNIDFFNNASACISHFNDIHWSKKVISLIKSFGTLLIYTLNKFSLLIHRVDAQMDSFTNTNGLAKNRLIVCIHGLNNNPSQFKKFLNELQNRDLSETDIFIPRVLQKGNALLDDMVRQVLADITLWANTPGEKELVLIGISNGGRISRAIEAEIAKLENNTNIKKLRFVSIVGACKGSSLVNLANKVGLSWLMSKNISEEMPTESMRNQQLNQEWLNGMNIGPRRDYTFIASPHDWQVTNYDSSLMEVNGQSVRYAIVPGHGHNSIVNAVAKIVAEIAVP